MSDLTLVLGGPGCGKTTRLLSIVEREMERGVPPGAIAFVAFTKAAAEEAKQRATVKFSLDAKRDLPYFRTLHSLAYSLLGVTRDEVMQYRDWINFGKMIGEPLNLSNDALDEFQPRQQRGDRMLYVHDFARNSGQALRETWKALEPELEWHALERFVVGLDRWKAHHGKLDYTDMILDASKNARALTQLQVAIVDEAQDLTRAQWALVDKLFADVERMYVGGDDDQAIYKWTGADVERFLSLKGKRDILPLSYRLPVSVWRLAQTIVARLSKRHSKNYASRSEQGLVKSWAVPDQVPIDEHEGTWLLLARNGYMLKQLETHVRSLGHLYRTRHGHSAKPEHVEAIYGWEDWRKGKRISAEVAGLVLKALGLRPPKLNPAQTYSALDLLRKEPTVIWHEQLLGIPPEARLYYRACLKRGEKLRAVPRIRLETIHGVKGAEADHVAVLSDMSNRTYEAYHKDPDNEHRVYYVAVTRAKQTLHLVEPQTPNHYVITAR